MQRVCIVPEVGNVGGMASFRRKFEAGLSRRGIEVSHQIGSASDPILIIGGTKNLLPLWRARRRGARIVQRLDGINWIHRKRNTGVRHYLRAEYGNLILAAIRARIAGRIVYQSEFSRAWWDDWYGRTRASCSVVLNGVDLYEYRPAQEDKRPDGRCRLLVVEGSLGGGYDMGLDNAVRLAETLAEDYGFPMELMVVGRITEEHRARVQVGARVPLIWAGVLPQADIPNMMRSAHALFSADLHPACPNSVIEALACGLPVVAFDTGSLRELVDGDAGCIVPYVGDPWKIETPDVPALAEAAAEMLRDWPRFSHGARLQAEEHLGLDRMIDGYLKALLEA
ncbi:MAG TPA: glycosyltransferase [Anaerolineales bacterium]|nr:glycosyltransferase [Anaerolineales bacterium]